MNLFYPKFRLSLLPAMLAFAALGVLLAGGYGILHDRVTYAISPECFTRLKFAGVVDLPNFVRVAYIHNASYLGGLIGLIIAMFYLRRLKQAARPIT